VRSVLRQVRLVQQPGPAEVLVAAAAAAAQQQGGAGGDLTPVLDVSVDSVGRIKPPSVEELPRQRLAWCRLFQFQLLRFCRYFACCVFICIRGSRSGLALMLGPAAKSSVIFGWVLATVIQFLIVAWGLFRHHAQTNFCQYVVVRFCIGLFIGVAWHGVASPVNSSIRAVQGVLFSLAVNSFLDSMLKTAIVVPLVRPLIVREWQNGYYSLSSLLPALVPAASRMGS
jgi:hypothetical protein